MSTTADLPASAEFLANPAGNGQFTSRRSPNDREDYLSWLVDFADLDAFYAACFDTAELIAIAGTPVMRITPLQHPFAGTLYCLDAQARALTASEVYDEASPFANCYGKMLATVRFGVLPYSFTDRPFVSVRRTGRSGVIAAPIGNLKFAGNNELIDLPPGLPVFQEDFVVTWHEVENIGAALGTIEPLAGMANSSGLTIDGRTYAAGTLHFPEFDAEAAISVGGNRKASLSFPVRWRPRPTWLQMIRKDGTMDVVTPALLQTGNLAPLFGI